jgi:hypothetical protein
VKFNKSLRERSFASKDLGRALSSAACAEKVCCSTDRGARLSVAAKLFPDGTAVELPLNVLPPGPREYRAAFVPRWRGRTANLRCAADTGGGRAQLFAACDAAFTGAPDFRRGLRKPTVRRRERRTIQRDAAKANVLFSGGHSKLIWPTQGHREPCGRSAVRCLAVDAPIAISPRSQYFTSLIRKSEFPKSLPMRSEDVVRNLKIATVPEDLRYESHRALAAQPSITRRRQFMISPGGSCSRVLRARRKGWPQMRMSRPPARARGVQWLGPMYKNRAVAFGSVTT